MLVNIIIQQCNFSCVFCNCLLRLLSLTLGWTEAGLVLKLNNSNDIWKASKMSSIVGESSFYTII